MNDSSFDGKTVGDQVEVEIDGRQVRAVITKIVDVDGHLGYNCTLLLDYSPTLGPNYRGIGIADPPDRSLSS